MAQQQNPSDLFAASVATLIATSVVVLVVQERPDDLLLYAFFLATNLGKFDWPPDDDCQVSWTGPSSSPSSELSGG
ncbi:hypothetical protein [Halomonas sp. H10-9-1]|uniref:hypothetical protein n=1 Tax=Halomonas sp. H10-9-1 TaxID=2950871 RepID=UPI0032E03C70